VLELIETGIQTGPRRVMLYGEHGIGKSTWAANAWKPIFIQTEDGLGQIDCTRFPLATSYEDVMAALTALYEEDHDFQTIVVDTLDWLQQLIFKKVCDDRQVTTIEDIGYAKGYTFAMQHWREVLKALDVVRRKRSMMVILLAHCHIEKVEPPDGPQYDRYSPKLDHRANGPVQEWCDEILFAGYAVMTKATDGGFNRKIVKAIEGERVVYVKPHPARVSKWRLQGTVPSALSMDFNDYGAYVMGKAPAAAIIPEIPSDNGQEQEEQTE